MSSGHETSSEAITYEAAANTEIVNGENSNAEILDGTTADAEILNEATSNEQNNEQTSNENTAIEETADEETSQHETSNHETSVRDSAHFLAVDVETANPNPASICAVGLVYFKAGQISRQMKLLIDPQDRFDSINTALHGIRAEHVSGLPTIRQMFPLIASALATTVVVHHSHFDRTALCRAAEKYGFPMPSFTWLDSAYVVRQTWKRFSKRGYGLQNLAEEFGIVFTHHDPCEDARAAGLILVRAIAESGLPLRELLNRYELPVASLEAATTPNHRAATPMAVVRESVPLLGRA